MISSTGTNFLSFFDWIPFSLIEVSFDSFSFPLLEVVAVETDTSVETDECLRLRFVDSFEDSGESLTGLIAWEREEERGFRLNHKDE